MPKPVYAAIVITTITASSILSSFQHPRTAQAAPAVQRPAIAKAATNTADTAATSYPTAAVIYSAYAQPSDRATTRATIVAATPLAGPTLPIEVLTGDNPANTTLFPAGFTKAVTINVSNAANIKKFWMQVYSLSYQDKASVQINNAPWVTLNNTTTAVMQPGLRYGGIGGANRTLKLTFDIPAGTVVNGDNVIRFRLNRTDGESMGFRVLNFNFWDAADAPVLPNPPLPVEDPNTWTPPRNNAADIAQGETLWHARNIMTNNPLDPTPFKASCADCHSQSGYDLKYFNFSNAAVIERSRFHGLSQAQGEQIASFIRALPFENPGRPWNPPYQPGPGLEAKPVEDWAAGAGVDAVLENDPDGLAALPGQAANADAFIDGARIQRFNVREMPVSIELPDWNHWLPRVHPIDSMGVSTFENSPNFLLYDRIRKGLLGALPGLSHDEYVQQHLRRDLDDWAYSFAPDSKSNEFAALGPTGNAPFTKKQVVEQYAAAIWSASKLFELMHEFELEELGHAFYGLQGESRQWLSNRHLFNFSPHLLGMSTSFPVTGDGNAELTNLYFANTWYWVQVILNPGARNSVTGGWTTNDWDYISTIMNTLYFKSGGREPIRSLLLAHEGMDNGDDGYGPEGRNLSGANGPWWGWDLRDNSAQLAGYWQQAWWDDVPASAKKPALTAAYEVWLEKSGSFSVDQWRKVAATRDAPDYALNLASPPYTFVIPNFGQNPDLENAATMLAYHARLVRDANLMDVAVSNAMADLGGLLWPDNPWNTLISRSGTGPANLQATPGIEQVALSWNSVAGATSYNVSRSDALTGTYVAVGLFVTRTQFVDRDLQAGRPYHYRVSANLGNSETNRSAAVSATPTFGLVGYWPMDDGANVADASVTANPSLLVGQGIRQPGHRGNAVQLGPQSFVAAERNLRWLSGDFSFAAWISTTASGNDNLTLAPALAGNVGEAEDNPFDPLTTQIDRRYSKTGNRFAIVGGLDASGRIGASFGTDTSAVVRSATPVNTGGWRHIVVSRNATSGLVKIYVDGALSASGTLTTGYLYQRAFGIGRPENGQLSNYFPGSLDEVRVYNRPLSDAEVLAVYADSVPEPTVIASGNPPTATVGTSYDFLFTALGNPTPTLTLSGTLPAGLSFIPRPNGTASLSGTPTTPGSFTFTITARNGVGAADVRVYTWVAAAQPPSPPTGARVRIMSSAPPAGTYGAAYTFNLTASGEPAPTLSVSGLPAGLSVVNGTITGTPLTAGTSTVTVTASNGKTSDVKVYAFTLNKAALSITVNSASRRANTPNPAFTVTYAGFVNGDDAGDLSGAPSITTTATAASAAGTYPIVVSGGSLASAYYEFQFVNGVLTVTAEEPPPTDNKLKTYLPTLIR